MNVWTKLRLMMGYNTRAFALQQAQGDESQAARYVNQLLHKLKLCIGFCLNFKSHSEFYRKFFTKEKVILVSSLLNRPIF